MRVAGFMSGSGSNITRLLALEQGLKAEEGASPFELVFIFSDRSDGGSRGEQIALEAGIPYFSHDVRRFHELRGLKRTVATEEGLAARREFDQTAARLIQAFEVDLIALGGYMSFLTLDRCVNVHPADLSLLNENGERRFVGDNAVLDAIAAGCSELRSSTIWTDQGVDTGPLLMVSEPLKVELPDRLETLQAEPERLKEVADQHQERLKEIGDWRIFPLTIRYLAEGRFGLDEKGRVYFEGRPVPEGVRL
jgi:folate-dependent phosphoribosylglycinamide formyltransferase PurN